jgi:hypothetical protein
MGKAVLSISGNVYKQQEMERRNVGKVKKELNIVNQLVNLHFLLFVNITGN